MDSVLAVCLSLQMILAIVAPGIPMGGRTVFISDIWVFAVLFVLALESYWIGWRLDRRTGWKMAGLTILMLVVLVHGPSRELVPPGLVVTGESGPASFNTPHEFVMMFRYLSWIVEGVWLWSLLSAMDVERRRRLQNSMIRALLGITFSAAGLTIMSGLDKSFLTMLADIYGYSASFVWWANRGYGPFRSPLEAGLTLSLCGLLLVSCRSRGGRIERYSRDFVALLAAGGLILSRTMTALMSVVAAWLLLRFASLRTVVKLAMIVSASALAVGLYFAMPAFWLLKWNDLTSRLDPWTILFKYVTSRWDQIVLGVGFYPVNVDNAYLFLVYKLGIVGALYVGYEAFQWGRRNWSGWNLSQREVILFLLISGMTLDTFIIRPVVMVFIAAGLPLLNQVME